MVMHQKYNQYTTNDLKIWSQLFNSQNNLLPNRASKSFISSVVSLSDSLNESKIVDFGELNKKLSSKNGWEVVVVPGLIPVEEFFEMLSKKQFPSSTWLRTEDQLEYLEEPDMFHDIYGHIPLLMNNDYADFMTEFGRLGVKYQNRPEVIKQLQTLYWFTIEFGLIKEDGQIRIYGAGILSSEKETKHIFESDINAHPFDIQHIINTPYDISDIQLDYFVIDSYKNLFESLAQFEEIINK